MSRIPNHLRYKSEHGYKLTKGTEHAAGFDVCSSEEVTLLPGHRWAIKTGLYLEIPENLYAQVESRSGLAVKSGLTTLCGVIDSDYRGELKIVLINLGRDPVVVAKGSRIAQLVFHEVPSVSTEMVENIEDLSKTQRKDGGFGSTGVN